MSRAFVKEGDADQLKDLNNGNHIRLMNTSENNKEKTDEIGDDLESGNEVNLVIEQQGDRAAAGIPRDTDAAKHEPKKQDDNRELQGAP